MHISRSICLVLTTSFTVQLSSAYVAQPRQIDSEKCTQSTVAILGGGMAGVAAAQALVNASIDDFVIIEYRDTLGGRVWHTDFGADQNGKPYVVEFGANWLQGVGSNVTENPVWTLAQKHKLKNTYSNYDNILTYDETGYTDYRDILAEYAQASKIASREAGRILSENLQDQTARSGLALAGWRPRKDDMKAQAVEWWNWDWEAASSPETSSFVFGIAGENLTFNQFGPANHLVLDPRGYNHLITAEAATFLTPNDPRLHLNTPITHISHSPSGVTTHTANSTCHTAAYAICTFSLGVLQNSAVTFSPPLPPWKQTSIHKFNMNTYTKLFLQFPYTFWPTSSEFLLYASPSSRGLFPVFQSLSSPSFLPNSSILFATVVADHAYRVERQSLSQTKSDIMSILRQMFPDIDVPEPVAFTYPRWSTEPWSLGSYSNWPAGTTLEMHQNLRANVDRLWFAGEATSAPYFGFLHGAWFEGRDAGREVADLLLGRGCEEEGSMKKGRGKGRKGDGEGGCGQRTHYEVLHGTTPAEAYSGLNGWPGGLDLSRSEDGKEREDL
ncbi:polyamine oxidase [Aspergillus steynii IBT 23096]|uniref:Amine oxidase n=1 Tax=Aspergillus steynii IBT 23096 TaxID=1392250 RepID=A0A2I2G8W0_9EURO|nr:polyamine oxidase [Aspergillus steynii IBT 23096]PLB49326.1 polyamine oxidase [Aspergillus steynii IBT 23096]